MLRVIWVIYLQGTPPREDLLTSYAPSRESTYKVFPLERIYLQVMPPRENLLTRYAPSRVSTYKVRPLERIYLQGMPPRENLLTRYAPSRESTYKVCPLERDAVHQLIPNMLAYDKPFAYGSPILWNNLYPNLHKIVSPQTFKWIIITHLYMYTHVKCMYILCFVVFLVSSRGTIGVTTFIVSVCIHHSNVAICSKCCYCLM